MDTSISPVSLHQSLGSFPPPLIIDVRREAASSAFDRVIAGRIRRAPDRVEAWAADLEIGRAITVYCAAGREASQDIAAALAKRGFIARCLVGGLDSWVDQGFPSSRGRRHRRRNG